MMCSSIWARLSAPPGKSIRETAIGIGRALNRLRRDGLARRGKITITAHKHKRGPLIILLSLSLLAGAVLSGCAPAATRDSIPASPPRETSPGENEAAKRCPVTEPLWVKPPEDAAVEGEPAFGHYFVNEDRSIWASAWWAGQEEYRPRAGEEGIKVGWFRPEGAELTITGRRLDGRSPPLEAHVPCCYPTRFQATGLLFPTGGCWEVTAVAAGGELVFVLWVEP